LVSIKETLVGSLEGREEDESSCEGHTEYEKEEQGNLMFHLVRLKWD